MCSCSFGVRFFSIVSDSVGMICGVSEVAVVGSNNSVMSRSRMIFGLVLWDIFYLTSPYVLLRI